MEKASIWHCWKIQVFLPSSAQWKQSSEPPRLHLGHRVTVSLDPPRVEAGCSTIQRVLAIRITYIGIGWYRYLIRSLFRVRCAVILPVGCGGGRLDSRGAFGRCHPLAVAGMRTTGDRVTRAMDRDRRTWIGHEGGVLSAKKDFNRIV